MRLRWRNATAAVLRHARLTMEPSLAMRADSTTQAAPRLQAWQRFMVLPTSVFVSLALALDTMPWWLVIRPLTRLSTLADRVSSGERQAPAFAVTGRDETSLLARSFGRMRESLVQAMKMLETATP